MLDDCSHVVEVFDWEHRQTDKVDMLYMLMDIGDVDLFKILNTHRKNKTLSINKIRFFWEEMLLVYYGLRIHEYSVYFRLLEKFMIIEYCIWT